MSDSGEAHEVGPFADEAAKLFGALCGWAREHATDAGWSGTASQAESVICDLDTHPATGSAECTVCPLCRAVHAVRQLSPEVRSHLATAMTSLAQAAALVLTPMAPQSEQGADVERVDVDDDWPDESTDAEHSQFE